MNGVRRFLGGGGATESPGPPAPLALDLDQSSNAGPSGLGSTSTASAYSIPSSSSGLGGGLSSPGTTTNALNGLGSAGLGGLGNTAALFLKKNKSQKKNGSFGSSSGGSMGAEDLGPWVSRGNNEAMIGGAVETRTDIRTRGRERNNAGSGSEPRRSIDTVNPSSRTNGFPLVPQIQRPTLPGVQPALPQSPTLRPPLQRTTRDDLLLSLLASEAVVESREFAILNLEEVEEYKKEETLLTSRLVNLSKKLETDRRIRDAAVTLSSLSVSKSKSTSTTSTSDQLASANLRYDTTLKEYNRVSGLKTDVSRKLLEHRAGVLGESVRRSEEQQAHSKSGTRSVRDSGYDTAAPSSPSNSAFNSFSFFAGHPSSASPFSSPSKSLSKDMAIKDSERDTITKDLSAQLKSSQSQIQMVQLEKEQVETMLGMEVQGLEERVQVSEKRLREAEQRAREAEERIRVTERDLNAERKGWEDERTSYEDQRGRMQQEFQEERGRMIEEMSRGGNGMQMMQSELEAKSQVITEMEMKLGQTQALLIQTQSQLQSTQAQLEQLELNTSTSLQELAHTHNIPLLTTSSSSGFLSSRSSSSGSGPSSSSTSWRLLEAIAAHLEVMRVRLSSMEQTQAEYSQREASFARKEEIWSQREAEFSRIKEQHTIRDSEFSRTKDDFGRKEQEYARREGEYLTQLRVKDESLRRASEEHSQEVLRMKVEFVRKEENWEVSRRRLEDDVRKGMDKREELGKELDTARREVLEMRMGGGVAGLRSPTSPTSPGNTAFPFPPPASLTSLALTDNTNEYSSAEAQSIIASLRPLWAVLPSPEARAAKFASSRRGVKGGSAGPGSPTLAPGNGPVSPGGSGAKSISDLDVRSLKSLYDASSSGNNNSSSPTSLNVEPFTLSSFISRINSLLADDRLLIERLLRFAQAHDLLKKNAERAQKLAMESNSALETYQRQVRVLEERNGELGRRVGESQDELTSLQDIIDRISSAKSDLEIHAAEQAETCRQLSEANNTLSARALLLAEEAAEAQAKARSNVSSSTSGEPSIALERDRLKAQLSNVQNELETLKKELKDTLEELEAMRSSGQAQNVMLMEELMVTQTENAELKGQLRGLKGK